MKLDTPEQRHKFIDDMINKVFEFEDTLLNDEENGDDWGGTMSTIDNLVAIEEMIRTEEIFLGIFNDVEKIRSHNQNEKEIFLDLIDDGLIFFIDTILLRRLEFAFDHLNDWDFQTESGKKFKKNYCKKLDALIKKYQDIYDL